MKKIVFFIIPFALSAQASQDSSQVSEMKKFSPDYIQAVNQIDTSKYCFYDDKLFPNNAVVEMGGGVLMQCKDVTPYDGNTQLQWEPYDKK